METINALFASAVKRFPERPALLEPTEGSDKNKGEVITVTYRELQRRVEQFAGYLQELHIAKGERLLLWSASRINWVVACLGSLLVGAVVVPLDVNSREDFLARLVETTEAKYLITTSKQYQSLKKPLLPLIDIDDLPERELDASALPEVQEDDLAELVFTSGTTGHPKGVMLSQRNIASNVIAALQIIDIHEQDRALSILPLSHMYEATVDIAILSRGASIVYARTLVPDVLLKLLSSQSVTLMVLVPQALQLFLSGIEREVRRQKREKAFELLQRLAAFVPFRWRRSLFAAVHKRFGGHFRFFISGGAYLAPALAERWENMGFRAMQGYGTTECSPFVSVTLYDQRISGTVGKAMPGQQVRIGEDGEILVHGANVAQGYWKNAEATAAAFRDGWYHTGDLGYLDERGFLYIKGRKKNLIVLANGLNVYPEDVENVLLTHPAIKDAVVIGLAENPANSQDQTVHAILLMEDPAQAKSVIQQANKQLAPHQQIRGFTIWPDQDFPRTHTLKVKRPELLERLPAARAHINTN